MAPKAQQLVFPGLLAAAGPSPADREYVRGVRVDRAGLARYLHLIRDTDDPERSPRPIGGRADRSPHRTLGELSAEACGNEILALLADGRPRTFNAIGVELLDHTADTLHGSPYEKALWELAARGSLEHTLDVPVLFRTPWSGEGVR